MIKSISGHFRSGVMRNPSFKLSATAGHQALASGTLYIFTGPGLLPAVVARLAGTLGCWRALRRCQ